MEHDDATQAHDHGWRQAELHIATVARGSRRTIASDAAVSRGEGRDHGGRGWQSTLPCAPSLTATQRRLAQSGSGGSPCVKLSLHEPQTTQIANHRMHQHQVDDRRPTAARRGRGRQSPHRADCRFHRCRTWRRCRRKHWSTTAKTAAIDGNRDAADARPEGDRSTRLLRPETLVEASLGTTLDGADQALERRRDDRSAARIVRLHTSVANA